MQLEQERVNELKSILLKQKLEVENRLNDTAVKQVEKGTTGDDVDRASQEEAQQLELNQRSHDQVRLKKIIQAIARIENNEYGFCEECGDDIAIARLTARPESKYCVECQTVIERKNQLFV